MGWVWFVSIWSNPVWLGSFQFGLIQFDPGSLRSDTVWLGPIRLSLVYFLFGSVGLVSVGFSSVGSDRFVPVQSSLV